MEKKPHGGSNPFLEELSSMPGGEHVRLCIQCGSCTASCPNADRMQYGPRQIIAMARAGMRDEVLSANSMWYCASCYLCTVRCPRDIKPTELMHALECISAKQKMSNPKVRTPVMYKTFAHFVYSTGFVPEARFMALYYFATNPLNAIKMIPTALSMVRHGRLSVKAERMKPEAERQLKAILDKAKELGGAS